MIAFAANSILCRLALIHSANSPVSFTIIRLFSGAVALFFFFLKNIKYFKFNLNFKTYLAPIMLSTYAFFFSLAYEQLTAGTGALILFSCVQITMMLVAFLRGQKMSGQEKIGVLLALSGFLYLVMPGVSRPPVSAATMMAIAGISWGTYSLIGQKEENPVFATAKNFLFTLPLLILPCILLPFTLSREGFFLAIISGAITSGLGYVLWYFVLKEIKTNSASLIQLSVPALAALGGILFLDEAIKLRLIIASILIFGGIFIKIKKLRTESSSV